MPEWSVMITRKFIEKVHYYFDELNYYEIQSLDLAKFEQSAINTLIHCKDLDDAITATRMLQFCLQKWNKIKRIFKRKLNIFNEYEYEVSRKFHKYLTMKLWAHGT